ncbi:MAG: hypothetical protein ACKVS6_09730 [Planctomycetota bacterium]
MTDAPNDKLKPRTKPAPRALPVNLHAPPRLSPLRYIGGKLGLAATIITMVCIAYFGWVLYGKYGKVFRKVFATNISSTFTTREEYFYKKFEDIDRAGAGRRFGFFSISTDPNVMKAYVDGESLVLDMSDVADVPQAKQAAREITAFSEPGADLNKLTLRFSKPRNYEKIAKIACDVFERVMDGAQHGFIDSNSNLPIGEIRFDDLPDGK